MTVERVSGLTQAQRLKMAQRLNLHHDRSDRGQLLPLTAIALAEPSGSVRQKAGRAVALAAALVSERLVVPVPVEVHPDDAGEHRHQGLGVEDQIPLPVAAGAFGNTVLAFSSAEQLAAWDPVARPMTMSAQRVALFATQTAAPPSIVVDVASSSPVTLPVAAVHALVGGDTWLPPWADPALAADLVAAAQTQCSDIVDVRVAPTVTPGQDEAWVGALQVTILFRADVGADFATQRQSLANALSEVSHHPRLVAAAPAVELVPKPVAAA